MNKQNDKRRLGVMALAIGLACGASAQAQETSPTITISGARFAADPDLAPIGATVITAQDIRDAGATDVTDAIRKVGGVFGRKATDGSPDAGLDLRGFGADSSQNMVVVLDGVRLSENELSGPVLSGIPVDTVDHIEIIRGGSSVLYGDGATGGVIRIVTKRAKPGVSSGNVRAIAGQFHLRDLRATVVQGSDGFALDASVTRQKTDNDRVNAAFDQTLFSGGAQVMLPAGRFAVRLDTVRQEQRFAGALTMAQYQANPHQANTPKDFGSNDLDRVSALYEQRVGAYDFAAEASHREREVRATYFSQYGTSSLDYVSRVTQVSPRVRRLSRGDGTVNELVAGIDYQYWTRDANSSFGAATADQSARALYLRDEFKFDAEHSGRVAAGARYERFEKTSVDGGAYATDNYTLRQNMKAWEVQGSYAFVPGLNSFLKAGQSYRVANADENGYTAVPNTPLKGQVSHDLELGAGWGGPAASLTARWFRHRLHDEIYYDPLINGYGANRNLDPTKRQGVELDGGVAIDSEWRADAHYQHVHASFTSGPYAGREMVLVPKNVLTARLTWHGGANTADLGAQWVDSQRYGGDFDNKCGALIPAHTTLDGRYARQFGRWELAVIGSNLTDKQYFENAYGCKAGIYPSDGRQLKIAARYDF